MPHPGFNFSRRSNSVLSGFSNCARQGYLGQIAQLRRRPEDGGNNNALVAGTVFHTLLEVFYTPEPLRGLPLRGTDGNPVLQTTEEVIDWYMEGGRAGAESIDIAYRAFCKYVDYRGDDRDVKARVIDRPEVNVKSDLSNIEPGRFIEPIPYAAQYDGVLTVTGRLGVMSFEHKLLRNFYANTLASYVNSGQIVGQVTLWNSRKDLVEKYGPMIGVIINLGFKEGTTHAHREEIYISRYRQVAHAEAVLRITQRLEESLYRRERTHSASGNERIWPQTGLMSGECVRIGYSCPFIDICQTGYISAALYQITAEGRENVARDGFLRLDPGLEVWSTAEFAGTTTEGTSYGAP